jgi:hypothetical protein
VSGIRFYENGQEVTKAEFLRGKPSLDTILTTPDGRKAIARSLQQDPNRRLGHESEACSVAGIEKDHTRWIKEQGLTGVEVLTNGNIRFSGSEREKDKYLAARGLQDHTTAGTDTRTEFYKARKKPTRGKK